MLALGLGLSAVAVRGGITSPPPLSGLVQTFEDDFDSLSLRAGGPTQEGYAAGSGTWMPRYHDETEAKGGSNDNNGEYEFYADPAYAWSNGFTPFTIIDGKLRIRAQDITELDFAADEIPDRPGGSDPYPFVSGILATKHQFSQQGGYFECRCKVPKGTATWPAFWLLPADGTWPPEIDVMEYNGVNEEMYTANLHTTGAAAPNIQEDVGIDLSADYHVYGIDWKADTVDFYLDGELMETVDVSTRPTLQKPMYLLLNLAIGSTLVDWVPAPDGTTPSPADLFVDWVRVWQRPGPNSLSLSANQIVEGASGRTVGVLSATAYGGDEDFTFSIVSDPDSKFTIDGTNLDLDAALVYDTDRSHDVKVRVTDSQGRTWERLFTVQVIEAEPSNPNLWSHPGNISDAVWTKDLVTVVESQTDPDGGTTAEAIMETVGTGEHRYHRSIAKAASPIAYHVEFKVKANGRDFARILIMDDTFANGGAIAWFDLASGTITDSSTFGTFANNVPFIIDLGGGYFRVGFDFTSNSQASLWSSFLVGTDTLVDSHAGDITKGLIVTDHYLGLA